MTEATPMGIHAHAPGCGCPDCRFRSGDDTAVNEMRRPPRQQDREPMTMDDLFRSYGNNSLRGK